MRTFTSTTGEEISFSDYYEGIIMTLITGTAKKLFLFKLYRPMI